MLMFPFFMEKEEWYQSGENGYELTELGASIPDVKKSFQLFSKLRGTIVTWVDEEGNVVDDSSQRDFQAFDDFETHLQEKYKNHLP